MSEGPPRKNLPERSTRENIDVFTLGEEHLDLHRIRSISAELPKLDMPVSALDERVRDQTWDDEPQDGASPSKILDELQAGLTLPQIAERHPTWEHRIQRIQTADYSYPVLLYKGVVVDGLHRTLHARADHVEFISAHILESLPANAFVSDEFMSALAERPDRDTSD